MADYIKHEDVIDKAKEYGLNCALSGFLQRILDDIPAADVRENVRGRWVKKESPSMIWCECSICGYRPRNNERSYFCPYCGADMRGAKDG